MMGMRNRVASLLALMALILLSACEARYSNHGYVPPKEDLEELVVGVDTRATVDDTIGAPSTSGLMSDGDYYYVRSQFREYAMFEPQEVDRRVLAISFAPDDTIENIEMFGLEDGNVVPISQRVTDSSVVGNGFVRQIFGNFGNIDPADMF